MTTPRTVYPFAHVYSDGPLAGAIWMFEVEYKLTGGVRWPYYRVRADTDGTWRADDTRVNDITAATMSMARLQARIIHEWKARHLTP